MNLSRGCVTTGLLFPWHFFILQCSLVEVQLKFHVNRIDLLGIFFPPFFFLIKNNAQEAAHLWAGAQPLLCSVWGCLSAEPPTVILLHSPKPWSCFQPALKMLQNNVNA